MSPRAAIVGISCDHRMVGPHPFDMAGEKYIAAARDGAGLLPLLIPVLPDPLPPEEVLWQRWTGFCSPARPPTCRRALYGGPAPRDGVMQDEKRDATTLPLLKAAIARGVPTLCICRGFQELNVAFGGTLHQHVQEVEGRMDHREDKDADLDMQYGPAHPVRVDGDGLLAKIVRERSFEVNSLHSQGIDRLAPALHADAAAPDGQIEAVSMPGAKGFLLGRAMASGMALAGKRCEPRHFRRFRRSGQGRGEDKTMSRNNYDDIAEWLKERRVGEVECLLADMAGIARGKILPTNKFLAGLRNNTLQAPGIHLRTDGDGRRRRDRRAHLSGAGHDAGARCRQPANRALVQGADRAGDLRLLSRRTARR